MAANLAPIGHDVWVGNYAACDIGGPSFDRIIHIYRDDADQTGVCKHVLGQQAGGLVIRYCEGDPLESMSVPVAEVIAYARRPGRLLSHCAAGMCRGPTLGILAVMARGGDPHEAIGAVSRGLWRDYRDQTQPELRWQPLFDLLVLRRDGRI